VRRKVRVVTPRAAVLLAALSLPGCLVLPVPTPEHGLVSGTGIVSEEETRLLEPGRTTRADVLLHFGQPALSRCQEQVLVYHWAVAHGWLIVAVGGPYAAAVVPIPIPKSYLVLFAFDADGRLAHVERGADLFAARPKPEPWLPADCAAFPTPPPAPNTLGDFLAAVPGGAIDASPPPPAPPIRLAGAPRRVRVAPLADARTHGLEPNQLVDRRFETGPFGVWSYRRATDLVRAVVASSWLAAGHELDEAEADLVVEGRVDRLELDVDWSWLGATERSVALELSLRVRSAGGAGRVLERRYATSAREPVRWRGDPALEWGAALEAALLAFGEAIAADRELARFVSETGGGKPVP
jgi:hypothetical protein